MNSYLIQQIKTKIIHDIIVKFSKIKYMLLISSSLNFMSVKKVFPKENRLT